MENTDGTGKDGFTLWKVHNKRLMSTALLFCVTPEGFVIGADGRALNALTTEIESDTEIKIFAFENQVASIVFAWSGMVEVRNGSSDFRLVEQTYDLLPQLDFNGFFAQELNAKLKNRLRTLPTNETGLSAEGIFLSYRKGQPWISEFTVFKNGRTRDCKVDEGEPNGEITIVAGPEAVFDKPNSLNEAKNFIKSYLDDCVADPKEVGIGGHVHIGKFTPEGFCWMLPPK